jgi:DNA-binding CsgD family transcriptional regulator/DNA-binding XRE family transcriptional regulator
VSAPVQVGPSPSGGGPVPFPDWDETLADIGDRIRAERQARGWSKDQLARRAGISRQSVKSMEGGSVWLRPLMKVCWAFQTPVDYLLSDQWRVPSRRPTLAPRQAEVLLEAASGDSLTQVGARLGMGSQAVAAALSRIYVRLGVAGLPRGERRAAAARVAVHYGLIHIPNRTS